jgi:hypothetical protein
MVVLVGIEPDIYRLKAYYPKPLDDRTIKLGAGSGQRSPDLTLDSALASPYNKPAHITICHKDETVKLILSRRVPSPLVIYDSPASAEAHPRRDARRLTLDLHSC